MAAVTGHLNFWNWTGDSILQQVWLSTGNSQTIPIIVAVSVIITGRFLHLERSSEEALVMAIKLYYIIYGSCRFNGWDSYLSIDSVLGLGCSSNEESDLWASDI